MGIPAKGVVIDRYRVEGVIGAGSMGDVVSAIDMDLQRKVAIKILNEKHRGNKELEARFVREGRAVAAISHTNVVQVFTTGTYDGRPYIAMEFLTGTDLGSFVGERGPMNSRHAARAILDSARGLQAAAQAGLIHRDVKPSNLVMLDSGVVKVTDFGLAKPLNPSDEPALTALGVVVGTPDYIAPEQARGETIDERVDIYALGGTLYFLLIGTPPFRKGNPVDDKYLKVVARHLNDPSPNPLLRAPDTDGELARLQLRLMSKKPTSRPSYDELLDELSQIVQRLGSRQTAPEEMPVTGKRPSTSSPTPYLGRRASTFDKGPTHGFDSTPIASSDSQAPFDRTPLATDQVLDDSLQLPVASGTSRLLLAVSALSVAVFVIGLGLYFFGPMPDNPPGAAVATVARDDAADAALQADVPMAEDKVLFVPKGMFLVPKTADRKAFFVGKTLVSYGEYSALFPNRKKPSKNLRKRSKAVVAVSYSDAQSYVRAKGGRLPTAQELSAVKANGDAQSTWEWVADEREAKRRPVGKMGQSKTSTRPSKGATDVGFRLVLDL